MTFLDIFNPIVKGIHGLTDEAIYSHIVNKGAMIPLYGGNNQHLTTSRYVNENTKNKEGQKIQVFEGEGIILSLDGSAGCMTYKKNERFALNHHAGFITIKDKPREKVNLIYFALFMRQFFQSLSVSDGSKTLTLDQIYSAELNLPKYSVQCKIVKELQPFIDLNSKLIVLRDRLVEELKKKVIFSYKNYQIRDSKINDIFNCLSGNSGLTEESIYNNTNINENLYKILSSATSNSNMFGYTSKFKINGKLIKVFQDNEGLLITRNGMAGKTYYLPKGNYTLNDHAYILFKKPKCPFKINLKWFSIEYRDEILSYSSASDNGTWNKTGFFSNTVIDLPSIEEQNEVANLYEKTEKKLDGINKFIDKINTLFNKEIII